MRFRVNVQLVICMLKVLFNLGDLHQVSYNIVIFSLSFLSKVPLAIKACAYEWFRCTTEGSPTCVVTPGTISLTAHQIMEF